MVAVEKEGRLKRYVVLVDENDYLEGQTRRFVDRVCGGDAKHLMAALLRQNLFSKEDYDELKMFWDGKKGTYVLGIAWNYDSTRFGKLQKLEIEAGGAAYPLYFSKGMEKWAKNEAILKATAAAVADKAPTAQPKLMSPVLTSVDGPFEGTSDELAARFSGRTGFHQGGEPGGPAVFPAD